MSASTSASLFKYGQAGLRGGCVALAAAALGCLPTIPADGTDSSTSTTTTTTTTEVSVTMTGPASGVSGIQTVTSLTPNPTTTEGTETSETSGPDLCPGHIDALAAMISAGQPCDVLVHLDEAAAPVGLHVACGHAGGMWNLGKEIGAMTGCCNDSPKIYPGEEDAPLYVLHSANPQGPDGVAILSNHTGQIMLDALTGEGTPGPIAVPASWTEPAALAAGMGCGEPGFSLESALSHDIEQAGAPLPAGDLELLAASLGDMALGPALAQTSTPVRAMVVRYAPEDGAAAHAFVLLAVTGN